MLYVSVPRWDSLTDRVYRFIYPRAGGHITPWRSAEEVERAVASAPGLQLLGKRRLFSSMRFLIDGRLPRWRRWLLWWANAWTVSGLLWFLWWIAGDRWLDYGWELYFGQSQTPPELEEERDVCCGCGAGHSAAWLEYGGHVRHGRGDLAFFRCPDCRQWNFRRSCDAPSTTKPKWFLHP
jgi:hypothetical protein